MISSDGESQAVWSLGILRSGMGRKGSGENEFWGE